MQTLQEIDFKGNMSIIYFRSSLTADATVSGTVVERR